VSERNTKVPSPLRPTPAAELVLDFVNTHPTAVDEEKLADGPAMAEWLRAASLLADDSLVTDGDAMAVREVRDALVTVLLAHAGESGAEPDPVPAAVEFLGRTGAQHPLVTTLTADGAVLVPAQTGVPGAVGAVLAAVTEVAQQGNWGRIKACRNPPCHSAFYDRTRNLAATYCSPGCSSQVSMRAYRQRKKES
jgi:predicted RNA-binding Zn ribbon-like protein